MQINESGTMSTNRSERILAVDVLRAVALFGIIITHAAGGFLAGPPPKADLHIFGSLDRFARELETLLTLGKFFTIFSFLFGLSFAIQLHNATRKGVPFAGRFAWRLAVLFGIGYVHNLFFSGDILMIYAVLGLLLIPFNYLGNKILIALALVLILNIPGLVLGISRVTEPAPTAEQAQAKAEARQQFVRRAQEEFDIKQSGRLNDVVSMNAASGIDSKLSFQIVTGRLWITFGLFLLGLCAGRSDLFRDTSANRKTFRRILLWTGLIALAASVFTYHYPGPTRPATLFEVFAAFIFSVQQASLSAFYVAGVTLLFWRKPTSSLARLAAMGKMGLTTYLTQTVFGLIVFYGFGFGLLGHLGVAASIALAVAFYVVQIFLAQWWMRHFNLGPMEWLWRSLTYLKLQPNARSDLSAA
jgi:uncharacterized protein